MEKHPNPFDEFLKETLKGHQLVPPEEAKKAFLREASTIIPANRSWLKWYYIPIFVILISGSIAFLYLRNDTLPGTTSEIPAERYNSSQNADSGSNPISTSTSIKIENSKKELAVNDNSMPVEPEIKSNEISANNKSSNIITKIPVNDDPDNMGPEIPLNDIPDKTDIPLSTSAGISEQADNSIPVTTSSRLALDSLVATAGRNTDIVNETKPANSDESSPMPSASSPEPGKPAKTEPVSYFAAGAYYLPEWMFNTIEGSKFINNFGFEGVFYRDRISIRTGLGISVSEGVTEKAVEYNAYLGSYNKLDSVTFIFSESSHDFLPNIHMSEEKVWDSNSKLDSTNVIKRYTYLQVPLVLGFDFWQRGRFTTGVRVGTIMSVILSSNQLSGAYNPGENQVLSINNLSPNQVSVNWQAVGGISASARLSKSIFLEIEPEVKYYYKSIYEKSGNTKKPWSLSIRTAIIYKF
jgi:hypothetical protein